MKIIDDIKKSFKRQVERNSSGTKVSVKIDSLRDAEHYLKAVKEAADGMESGTIKSESDVEITTATPLELREFLNYCISLMPDKYIKHKILLFLRVNPYWESAGKAIYLSKRQIASMLSRSSHVGRVVTETEVDGIERDAISIAQDSLAKLKVSAVPIVGHSNF